MNECVSRKLRGVLELHVLMLRRVFTRGSCAARLSLARFQIQIPGSEDLHVPKCLTSIKYFKRLWMTMHFQDSLKGLEWTRSRTDSDSQGLLFVAVLQSNEAKSKKKLSEAQCCLASYIV